jgi:hypothetical protein
MRYAALALVVVIGIGVLAGCGAMPSDPAQSSSIPSIQPAPSPTVSADVAVLQAQLDEMRHADEALLSTVHWALGIMATVGIAILGFNFFSNRYRYQHDQRVMREELIDLQREEMARRTRILEGRFSRRQSAFERRARAQYTKTLLKLGQVLWKKSEEIEHEIYKTHFRVLSQEVEQSRELDEYGAPSGALGPTAHGMLIAAMLIDHEYGITRALDSMILSIEKGVTTRDDAVDWMEHLDALPSKFAVHVERIKTLLMEKKESDD